MHDMIDTDVVSTMCRDAFVNVLWGHGVMLGRMREQSSCISIAVCIYDSQCFTVRVISNSVKGLGCEGKGILTAGFCFPKNTSRPLYTFDPNPYTPTLHPNPTPQPTPQPYIPPLEY